MERIGKYGIFIKEYRLAAGLTQGDLAKRLGLTNKCISAWESGRNEPRMEQIVTIANACDCPVSYLFGVFDEKADIRTIERSMEDMSEAELKRIVAFGQYLIAKDGYNEN